MGTTRGSRRSMRLAIALVVLAMLAAACADDTATSTTADAETTETTATTATTLATTDTEAPPETAGDLSKCPNPLVIQTDWFPQPEQGPFFQLTGGVGSIDPDSGRFQGPLTADPSITIEIRAGGPYIGNQQTTSLLYTDDEIFLGTIGLDEAITNYGTLPTIAVIAPQETNPLGLMYDPATYDFASFSDVGASGATVNVFPGMQWIDYLIASNQISADQFEGSFDGSPTRFISEEGALVQQGFATQDGYAYEHTFEAWGKPVKFLMLHDSGYENYSGMLSMRTDKLDEDTKACLSAFVPLVQQAAVDFMDDPEPVLDAVQKANDDLASFYVTTPESNAATVVQMAELRIIDNGPDDTVGNFDLDRVQGFFDLVKDLPSFNFSEGLTPEDLVTNEFVDPSIGL